MDYAKAESAYQSALSLDPENLTIRSNLLALNFLHQSHQSDVKSDFLSIVSQLPSSNAATLLALRAIANDNFGKATESFAKAF